MNVKGKYMNRLMIKKICWLIFIILAIFFYVVNSWMYFENKKMFKKNIQMYVKCLENEKELKKIKKYNEKLLKMYGITVKKQN